MLPYPFLGCPIFPYLPEKGSIKRETILRLCILKMLLFYSHSSLLVWLGIQWQKIIFLQNFEDVVPLISSFQCSYWEADVILIPGTMYAACFFILETFKIFSLVLVFGNFMMPCPEEFLFEFLMLGTCGLSLEFTFHSVCRLLLSPCFQEGSSTPIIFAIISFPAFNVLLWFLRTLS